MTFTRGDDLVRSFTIKRNGVGIDVTGAILWFTVKTNETDADVDAIIQNEFPIPSATTGVFTWTLVHSITGAAKVVPGTYYYDFQLVSGGNVTTLVIGKVKIKQDITLDIA
jgi:hypothetical protein